MVWIRHGKVLLDAVGILILCNYCWESDWKLFVKHTWCSLCFRSCWKIVAWIGILSLFKYFSAHLVHCRFTSRWKILDWGRYNFELVQMFLKNQIGDCFVMHVLCSLCVFFRDGKFLVEALPGGMLRFCNYSWKLDWSLFCFARMVWTLCFSFVIENSCFRHVGI